MLSVNRYPQDHVDQCRRHIDRQLSTYRALVKQAKSAPAVAAFAPIFFGNLVVVLDSYFVHRSRTIEGKDGNPLNEVRMICTSIISHESVMAADKAIKLRPEGSVLGIAVGAPISLTEKDFRRLVDAFLAEIERKYA